MTRSVGPSRPVSAGRRPSYFDRKELDALLQLYARRVAAGEWRDYAIDHKPGLASFSVFRSTYERATYTVTKHTAAANRPAEYSVLSGRERLASGRSLDEVLQAAFSDRRLQLVSSR